MGSIPWSALVFLTLYFQVGACCTAFLYSRRAAWGARSRTCPSACRRRGAGLGCGAAPARQLCVQLWLDLANRVFRFKTAVRAVSGAVLPSPPLQLLGMSDAQASGLVALFLAGGWLQTDAWHWLHPAHCLMPAALASLPSHHPPTPIHPQAPPLEDCLGESWGMPPPGCTLITVASP
jgi:hypothetical protein